MGEGDGRFRKTKVTSQILHSFVPFWEWIVEKGNIIIIFHSRDFWKISGENTHLKCKFLGHVRPLGLTQPKDLHK